MTKGSKQRQMDKKLMKKTITVDSDDFEDQAKMSLKLAATVGALSKSIRYGEKDMDPFQLQNKPRLTHVSTNLKDDMFSAAILN